MNDGPPVGEPATLWLVRHGHTRLHGTDGIAGRLDVGLSETGRATVRTLGSTLPATLARRRTAPRWYASPSARTRETAALLRAAASTDMPLAIDERLLELDFGDWEGSTWEAVHRDHPAALAAWGDDWVRGAPPNGETFEAQLARCGAWLDDPAHVPATGRAPASEPVRPEPDGRAPDAIVVAHGGSIRALLCHLLGHAPEAAMRFVVDPASVCRLERDARLAGGWRLVTANVAGFE